MKFYRALINIIFTLLIPAFAPSIIAAENPVKPNINSNLAAVLALNKIAAGSDGIVVQQSRHSIVFTKHDVAVLPLRGPTWQWQTEYIGPAYKEGESSTNAHDLAEPVRATPDRIEFQYADITETYVLKHQTVEQQFVIHKPITLANKDLLVKGRIISKGVFNKTADEWQWRDTEGSVTLGHVTVIDARGNKLPASMEVTANAALIQVDWQALGKASYPVTIDPEIGTNDFRISDMGPDGNANNDAYTPKIAYNSTDNQYLVVWRGDDNSGLLTSGEFEILGQRIDASNGTLLGTVIRVSDMGPNSNVAYGAFTPAVTYSPTANEYLVVWKGDDNTGVLVDEEFEIFGQRIDAATGNEVGNNDFRISDMGPDGNMNYDASSPAVAYNDTDDEYLVTWHGDDNSGTLIDNEFEIFGQRINAATGNEIGTNDFRISDMGLDGNSSYVALEPSVTYNPVNAEYLVVWRGDDNTGTLADNEYEIFGQRVDAATGNAVGSNDFRISDMGPDGNTSYIASRPTVTHNTTDNEYLVVWEGSDSGTPTFGEYEIWGQRLNGATGAETGTNDFRISDMGPDGNTNYHAYNPAVAYDITDNEYLVTWYGDDSTATVTGEYEIFGQRINAATGDEIGNNDFRISDMGSDGNTSYSAITPAIAYNVTNNRYLTAWSGDDNSGALADDEFEIFGQDMDATNGTETGENDFRITVLGSDSTYDARFPDVTYNIIGNEYLVVWSGDDDSGSLTDDEFEIFGQRIDAGTGARLSTNFRISDMGPDGNANYDATNPAVAYNITKHEYLVVWGGDDNTTSLVDGEFEIFGQRIDAATGNEVGTNDFRISDMGPNGDTNYSALVPDVTYNVTNNEYLVVWQGDDNTGPLVDGEFEIFGQRINAATGAVTGDNDFRISDMGTDGDVNFAADGPAVEYNTTNNEYLVVWRGDDNSGTLVDDEFEIFGQRLNATTGAVTGDNDFRISDMGPDGDATYEASPHPAVAYNKTNNEFLVVWSGDDNSGTLTDDEFEIFGQRIQAKTGLETGNNDFRISDMGLDGNANYDAWVPEVIYNVTDNEYLVVWRGDDNTGTLVNDEFEIFGQKINAATGSETGDNDFRISDMGPDGSTQYATGDSLYPDYQVSVIAYNATYNEYLVVWHGDDNTSGLADDEFEIFGQLISNNTTIGFTSTNYIGNEGGTISISIERIGGTGNTVTLDYMTSDGTAASTTDYTTSNGQISFMPGEKIKTFAVIITSDAVVEDDETVNLSISNVASDFGQTIIANGKENAIITVINDDSPPPPVDNSTTFVNVILKGGGGIISLWFLLLLGSGVIMSTKYWGNIVALRRHKSGQ